MLSRNAELVAEVLRRAEAEGADPTMRAIAATRSLASVMSDTLQALVDQARAEGRTWAQIGEVLHTTRQAAFQRFGRRGGERREAERPANGGSGSESDGVQAEEKPPAVPQAAEQALLLLDRFLKGRFEEIRSDFDERMLNACPVELLQSALQQTLSQAGGLEQTGRPAISMRHGYTVVDVPIAFERSDRTGRVVLNVDSEVSGLFMLPPDAS